VFAWLGFCWSGLLLGVKGSGLECLVFLCQPVYSIEGGGGFLYYRP